MAFGSENNQRFSALLLALDDITLGDGKGPGFEILLHGSLICMEGCSIYI